LLVPGLVSGWLFAAILSFNEFTASLFVTVQRTQTLPVALYNYVREYADPSMAAISVIYIVITATLLTFANTFFGLAKVLNVEHSRGTSGFHSGGDPAGRRLGCGRACRCHQTLRRRHRARQGIAAGPPRRVDDAARALGLRQDHPPQPRRRLPDA